MNNALPHQGWRNIKKYNLKLDAQILFEYRYMLKVLSMCWLAAFTEINIGSEKDKLDT
jgi:hypothetical protein